MQKQSLYVRIKSNFDETLFYVELFFLIVFFVEVLNLLLFNSNSVVVDILQKYDLDVLVNYSYAFNEFEGFYKDWLIALFVLGFLTILLCVVSAFIARLIYKKSSRENKKLTALLVIFLNVILFLIFIPLYTTKVFLLVISAVLVAIFGADALSK